MGTVINFLVGFATTAVVVIAVIWVVQRYGGVDISQVGKGPLPAVGTKAG